MTSRFASLGQIMFCSHIISMIRWSVKRRRSIPVRINDAAYYLCAKSAWKISNLQIPKVLHMADMNFVGQAKGRLVDEAFEAWDYGPVLHSLYHKCKDFGSKAVPQVFWGHTDILGTKEAAMLDTAWKVLKTARPGQLVQTTHSSSGVWVRRYVAGAKQIKIFTQDMIEERVGPRY